MSNNVVSFPILEAKDSHPHPAVASKLCLDLSCMNEEERNQALQAAKRNGVRDLRYQWDPSLASSAVSRGNSPFGGTVLYDLQAMGDARTLQQTLAGYLIGEMTRASVDWRVDLDDYEVRDVLQGPGRSVLVNIEPQGTMLFPVGKLTDVLVAVQNLGLGGIVCHASLFQFRDCCRRLRKFIADGFLCLVTGTATKQFRGHVRHVNGHVLASTVFKLGGNICLGREVLIQGSNMTTTMAQFIGEITSSQFESET